MYGRWEGELWFHRRHMWPVPSPSTPSLVAPINSCVFIDSNTFSKDGRKIHVGDCALFKPPHDSPPFVGLIRRLIVGKEDNLNLSVNWLYRPADVKLVKGASLEAAPNEVFYSFHQDEIPAASLLHPCKVAFLRKGVELPSRISSFVCRRVYDIESKRLWWLTDQDYINERQEEVDQLLDKTRVEMYGALQAGGHSPKPLNGPNGTTQLKSSTDNIQNSSSIPSQVKSKKREHGVHSSDSVKRERLSKADDADSAQLRPEDTLKIEIAKITDKGGLVDFEGVEKIIQLMQPETAEKKVDLACRIMLVDVISVTESFDCLGRFVQLRGLLILDEWLQEVHKGKIGDGSPKGSDKSVEEFLFALLRALDRLPVNLHALQTCNVGKSVNHLRSHKNPEILKKARSLVDTWKKRVEAEMNIIETRSGTRRGGSWPNKSMMSEVSHMGSRRISGSSEGPKISTSQPSVLKAQQGKHNPGEAIVKSPESPSSTKPLAPVAAGTGSSDVPPVTTKEEKSSSSSPSANNSHSCSSEHGKVGASCKEDAPSSTSGSINKISSGISHSRKSSNVVHGSAVPGVQKEGGLGKSVDRNFVSGKGSPIRAAPERVADTSFADNLNNQRLIVRLPSTGPSPARTGGGGSVEDASTTFGKSSLVHSEKQDLDRRTKGKGDAPPGNNVLATSMNSCQGKDGLVGFDDVKKGMIIPCDEHGQDGEIVERLTEASKATGSASGGTLKSAKSYEASYSSINALVESCAKFAEVNASTPVGDDVGMNLLASVAAGEMSRSDASPAGSPENKRPLPEDAFPGNDAKSRQSIENGCQSEDNLKVTNGHVMMEQVSSVGYLPAQGGSQQQVLPAVNHVSADGKAASFVDSAVVGLPQNGNSVLVAPEAKPAALIADASASASLPSIESTDAGKEGDGVFQSHDGRKFSPNRLRSYRFPNLKPNSTPLSEEDKNAGSAFEKATENKVVLSDAAISAKVETQINDESASWSSSEKHEDEKKLVLKASSGSNILLQKEHSKGSELPTTSCGYVGLRPKAEEAEDKKTGSLAEQSKKANMDPDSSVLLQTSERAQESKDKKEVLVSGGSAPSDKSPVVVVQEDRTCLKQSDVAEGDISEQPASRGNFPTISAISMPVSETVVKLDFDLNEVLPSDDGIQGDVERPSIPGRFSAVHAPCSLPSASSLMTGNRPASITVAAAAKGPFISSENLLRGKPELGWKGSAATSAFRPAEPRKVIDVPVPDNKQARGFLDFDLNVGVVEDVGNSGPSGGGLDLDLNACEEIPDVGHLSVGINRPAIPQLPPRSLLSGRFSNLEPNSSRGFDLNNGPGVEETGGESMPLSRNGMQFLSAVPSMRMNNMEMGNFSWFPPNSTYPAITVPAVLPGRGEQSYSMVPGASSSQRMLSPAGTSFNAEIFRGPVLSSSPAVAFSSGTPFQFPGFPFETNFSVPSNTAAYVGGPSGGGGLCFPTIPSGGYRPSSYVMSVGGSNVDTRKWGSQQQGQGGLDLNSSGPGGGMTERGDDSEQLKMFHQQMAGGLKRKEPVDGWDGDRSSSYKHHPSWQ